MIYTWRKRFGGFQASDVGRLKQLEAVGALLISGSTVFSVNLPDYLTLGHKSTEAKAWPLS